LSLTKTPPRFGGKVPEVGEDNLLLNSSPPLGGEARRGGIESSSTPLSQPLPRSGERSPSGPLQGIRIIDFSMGWAGPVCTRHLADLGADVIKIEACGYPDWWRGVDNRIETVTERLYEKSSRFNIMNRGKRAITLDLTQPEGVRLAKAL